MRDEQYLRLQAVLNTLDEASGGETPRHWSTWRAVIASAICTAVDWVPPPPPPPRCPGCGVVVDGTERVDRYRAAVPGEKEWIRTTWICCAHVRTYGSWKDFGYRYERADLYEPVP